MHWGFSSTCLPHSPKATGQEIGRPNGWLAGCLMPCAPCICSNPQARVTSPKRVMGFLSPALRTSSSLPPTPAAPRLAFATSLRCAPAARLPALRTSSSLPPPSAAPRLAFAMSLRPAPAALLPALRTSSSLPPPSAAPRLAFAMSLRPAPATQLPALRTSSSPPPTPAVPPPTSGAYGARAPPAQPCRQRDACCRTRSPLCLTHSLPSFRCLQR